MFPNEIMSLPERATGTDEDATEARMELETYRDKYKLGDVPVLDDKSLLAMNTYGLFHNQRTHEFPGAYAGLWESIEIHVDGPEWVEFIEVAWIRINATIAAIRAEKLRRERENPR